MGPSYHRQDKPKLVFSHSSEYKELHQNTILDLEVCCTISGALKTYAYTNTT